MFGRVVAINYGASDIAYVNGESKHKENPELIFPVIHNLMSDDLDAEGIWDSMRMTFLRYKTAKKFKNTVFRVELSPPADRTKDFSMEDWRAITKEYLREFDAIEMKKNGKVFSKKTNVSGSKYIAYLHLESDSGIPHIHIVANRIDEQGNMNNDHQIRYRAQEAADRVARNRGWQTATEIGIDNRKIINRDCYKVLKSMPHWDFDDYSDRLAAMGYIVIPHSRNRQRGEAVHGYSIKRGNSIYKASKLGHGRDLMISKIEDTWRKLHPTEVKQPSPATIRPASRPVPNRVDVPNRTVPHPLDYTRFEYGRIRISVPDLRNEGRSRAYFIPHEVNDIFDNIFDYREIENVDALKEMAVRLFVGWLDGLASPTGSGGGGTSSDLRWGRDPREDDLEFARRCARQATKFVKPIPRKGRGLSK